MNPKNRNQIIDSVALKGNYFQIWNAGELLDREPTRNKIFYCSSLITKKIVSTCSDKTRNEFKLKIYLGKINFKLKNDYGYDSGDQVATSDGKNLR